MNATTRRFEKLRKRTDLSNEVRTLKKQLQFFRFISVCFFLLISLIGGSWFYHKGLDNTQYVSKDNYITVLEQNYQLHNTNDVLVSDNLTARNHLEELCIEYIMLMGAYAENEQLLQYKLMQIDSYEYEIAIMQPYIQQIYEAQHKSFKNDGVDVEVKFMINERSLFVEPLHTY